MDQLYHQFKEKLEKVIIALQRDLATLRAGRASSALVENLDVDYYGTPTPLNQLAGITVPEARLIVIQPWDKNSLKGIEKAILKSDLGLTPANDGNVIRLSIPQLTEERRRDLVKVVRKKGEECKVVIRNIRREVNEKIKVMEKDGEISEDTRYSSQEKIQEITDKLIKEAELVIEAKEMEIMEV